MIDTAIAMSPADTTPAAGAGAAQKSQPDGVGFGAVLDSKIKDEQSQTQDASSGREQKIEGQPDKPSPENRPDDDVAVGQASQAAGSQVASTAQSAGQGPGADLVVESAAAKTTPQQMEALAGQTASKKAALQGLPTESNAQEMQPDVDTDADSLAAPQDKTDSESPKNLFAVKLDPRAAPQAKPVETQPPDVTVKPHVMAALTDETTTQGIKVSVSDGSAKTGGDSTQSSQSQPNAAFVIPTRTSFESVITGLDKASTPQSAEPSTTEIIDQVVQQIKLRQFQGQTDMTIKLNPAELGALRLHISQNADGMTSLIHASSDHVKGLLQANLPALTQALLDAGVKMEQVTVTSGTPYGWLMHDSGSGTERQKSNSGNSGGSPEASVNPAAISAATGGVALGGSVGYNWLA